MMELKPNKTDTALRILAHIIAQAYLRDIRNEQSEPVDGELSELWDKVKGRVSQLDVRDSQIADWFQRNYRLYVRLSDFDLPTPPPRITADRLEHFLKALERQADSV